MHLLAGKWAVFRLPLSTCTTAATTRARRASFYFLPTRLNVVITRARVKHSVVGSSRLTPARFESPQLQEWTDSCNQFPGSCHRITRLGPLKRTKSVANWLYRAYLRLEAVLLRLDDAPQRRFGWQINLVLTYK